MAYCDEDDLRVGDVPLPPYIVKAQYIEGAAEEIDAALGHIYVTPIALTPEANSAHRPAFLLLKKINWLLASARLLFDVAVSSEDDSVNAYGFQMLREAQQLIGGIQSGNIALFGAVKLEDPNRKDEDFTGPRVVNVDETSLVEDFYKTGQPTFMFGHGGPRNHPYSGMQ